MRVIWWMAVLAGASYCFSVWLGWTGGAVVAWKGLGVGLLALWAAGNARSLDGWLITVVLTLHALGDVLIDLMGLSVGAAAFLLGHIVAIIFYLRNPRAAPGFSQTLLSRLIPPLTVVIAVALVWRTPGETAVGIYAAGLGVMAATAWASRFPRYRVGIGAMLFVASDLLIFSRATLLSGSMLPTFLVWPLYFGGQLLIATGTVETLVRNRSLAKAK